MKTRVIVTNSFSLNMLDNPENYTYLQVTKQTAFEAYRLCETYSTDYAVGHADTARIFSKELELDYEIKPNRATVKLDQDTIILVGQYSGPRLSEGATELPEGAKIEWFTVELINKQINDMQKSSAD